MIGAPTFATNDRPYTRDDVASALGISKASIPLWIMQGRLPPITKPIAIGLPDYWPGEVIADYLPGGPKAPSKRPPGRKPMTRAEVSA